MSFDYKKFAKKNTGFLLFAGTSVVLSLIFIGLSFVKKSEIAKEQQSYKQGLSKLKNLDKDYRLDAQNREVASREEKRVNRLFRELYDENLRENYAVTEDEIKMLKKEIESTQKVSDLEANPAVMRQYYSDVLAKKWENILLSSGMKTKVVVDAKATASAAAIAPKSGNVVENKNLEIDFSFNTWVRDQSTLKRSEVMPLLEQFIVIEDLISRIAEVAKKDCEINKRKETSFSLGNIARIPLDFTINNGAGVFSGDQYFVQKDYFRLLPLRFIVNATPKQLEMLLAALEQKNQKPGVKQRIFIVDNVSLKDSSPLSGDIRKRIDVIKAEVAGNKDGLIYRDNFIAVNPDRLMRAVISVTFVDFKEKTEDNKKDSKK